MMESKTIKELKQMGVASRFGDMVLSFNKENELTKMESVLLLQHIKCYLLDMVILDQRRDK